MGAEDAGGVVIGIGFLLSGKHGGPAVEDGLIPILKRAEPEPGPSTLGGGIDDGPGIAQAGQPAIEAAAGAGVTGDFASEEGAEVVGAEGDEQGEAESEVVLGWAEPAPAGQGVKAGGGRGIQDQSGEGWAEHGQASGFNLVPKPWRVLLGERDTGGRLGTQQHGRADNEEEEATPDNQVDEETAVSLAMEPEPDAGDEKSQCEGEEAEHVAVAEHGQAGDAEAEGGGLFLDETFEVSNASFDLAAVHVWDYFYHQDGQCHRLDEPR